MHPFIFMESAITNVKLILKKLSFDLSLFEEEGHV